MNEWEKEFDEFVSKWEIENNVAKELRKKIEEWIDEAYWNGVDSIPPH